MSSSEAAVAAFASRVADNIEKVIVGKRSHIDYLIVAILARGHVLLEDVPGTGKTMLARAAAASMDLQFNRLQCTPDLLPNDVTGFSIYNQNEHTFEFRPGPVHVNILLADEINRATPRTQSALLEAMQERQVTVDGVTHMLPDPFLVLATQNPVEFEGTFPLPEAQLDRFLLRLPVGYPGKDAELDMARRLRKSHPIDTLTPVVGLEDLEPLYDLVTNVHIDETVERYVIDVVYASREHPDVRVGVSPRGTLALFRASQALAAVRGRAYIIPDDVKEIAPLVLSHRLLMRPESQLRGRTPAGVVAEFLSATTLDVGEVG